MIILAAGRGTRLHPLTETRPKCLVELGGKPLLEWQMAAARAVGIDDFVVVGGYLANQLEYLGVPVVVNADFETTNMVATLFCAEDRFGDGFILSYSDIVYGLPVLEALLLDQSPTGVVVDRDWLKYWEMRFEDPLSDAESLRMGSGRLIESIGQRESDIERIQAQYIGLMAFRGPGVGALRQAYANAQHADANGRHPFNQSRSLDNLYMTDLLQGMIDLGHPVTAVPINGGWMEIDDLHDLELAEGLLAQGRVAVPVV